METTRVPDLPPNLTLPCKPMQHADSALLEEILQTHTDNMESAGRCRERHGAILELFEELEAAQEPD